MINKQLKLLEELANISLFDPNEATKLWEKLIQTTNKPVTIEDHKNIRNLLSETKRFADCTQIIR